MNRRQQKHEKRPTIQSWGILLKKKTCAPQSWNYLKDGGTGSFLQLSSWIHFSENHNKNVIIENH